MKRRLRSYARVRVTVSQVFTYDIPLSHRGAPKDFNTDFIWELEDIFSGKRITERALKAALKRMIAEADWSHGETNDRSEKIEFLKIKLSAEDAAVIEGRLEECCDCNKFLPIALFEDDDCHYHRCHGCREKGCLACKGRGWFGASNEVQRNCAVCNGTGDRTTVTEPSPPEGSAQNDE